MHLADINDVNRNRNMVNLIIVPLQLKKMVIVTMDNKFFTLTSYL